VFNEKYYENLDGGILESFAGRDLVIFRYGLSEENQ